MTSNGADPRAFARLLEQLDPKERAFVHAYLDCLNAAEAARRVRGHSRAAKQKGYELLHRPDVRAAIDAALRERSRTPSRQFTSVDPDNGAAEPSL